MSQSSKSLVDEVFENLSAKERGELKIAFEEITEKWLVLADNKYIGCHMQPKSNFKVLEQAGFWQYGEIE